MARRLREWGAAYDRAMRPDGWFWDHFWPNLGALLTLIGGWTVLKWLGLGVMGD